MAEQDQFDALDLTDNQIRRLENFPTLKRLRTLLLANNFITRIDAAVGAKLPSLETLVLTNNRITTLAEVEALSACTRLTTLSLMHNAVCRRDHYRLFAIHRIPSLRVLDFRHITRDERAAAEALFRSPEGRTLKAAVARARELLRQGQPDASAVPSSSTASSAAAASPAPATGDGDSDLVAAKHLTPRELAAVRFLLDRASTSSEVDRIEAVIKVGRLAEDLLEATEAAMVAMIDANATGTPAPAPAAAAAASASASAATADESSGGDADGDASM